MSEYVKPPKKLFNIYPKNGQAGNVYDANCCAPCLPGFGAGGGGKELKFMDGLRIRKLTPKECFRLMGFEDSDFEKAEAINSNSQLYKQAGNSIVVPVVQGIIQGLFDCGALVKPEPMMRLCDGCWMYCDGGCKKCFHNQFKRSRTYWMYQPPKGESAE